MGFSRGRIRLGELLMLLLLLLWSFLLLRWWLLSRKTAARSCRHGMSAGR